MNPQIKELLLAYNVPHNVINIITDYHNNVVESVKKEFQSQLEQQQATQKEEEKGMTVDEFKKLSYTERVKMYQNNPELYNKLTGKA